jgi:hypothetical protein
MPTVYVVAYVPDAARAAAESALAAVALGPGDNLTVPLNATGSDADPVTHWGCCAAVADDGPTVALLPALKVATGGDYAIVSPWRSFATATHWHGWLLTRGLRPVTPASPN